ncbi:LacI family DNA-binding transcriptional regulator [Tamlana sp. 2201CG12-4]|uniref:LacI family DNA-binding transcriptional regulator n=1 Tax=Tamlana sp. 2201CG12-4 TaxID=3112582 RepID=UPI002DB72D6C|nr:LacI family DNA-binding transcriptional regulator [Tamlana sp. 2201CG12-4]MEC3905429.1 LacI family DNA-binding transcriptional regulator [Tamlana sp. 2201CG12-4]
MHKLIKFFDIKKKTTIKDIAKALNLTSSTVSRALNDNPRISNKTKEAVRLAAKELNYEPNYLASALRKGKSNLVGLIIPRANSNFFSSIVKSVGDRLSLDGYNIIITQSNESYERECENIESLLYTQVDGIIASLANDTVQLDHYEKIKSKGIPLIIFDRGEDALGVDYIGIDDYLSSFKVVEHLYDQGCRRIAHIGGYRHTRIYQNRIEGYIDALKKYNLPVEDDLIIESTLKREDGRKAMEDFLKLGHRPDAVYAAGDFATLGALQVLQEHKISVPDEVALVGFSNEPFTSLITPSISSIEQHSEAMGRIAAETFLDRINHPEKPVKLNKIVLDTELIIRQSSNRNK